MTLSRIGDRGLFSDLCLLIESVFPETDPGVRVRTGHSVGMYTDTCVCACWQHAIPASKLQSNLLFPFDLNSVITYC